MESIELVDIREGNGKTSRSTNILTEIYLFYKLVIYEASASIASIAKAATIDSAFTAIVSDIF